MGVQSQLLAALRTGHPMVDAVLTALLIALLTTLAARWQQAGTQLWSWVWLLRSSSITVKRVDIINRGFYDERINNQDYEALTWFITTRAETPAGGSATLLFFQQQGVSTDAHPVEVFLPEQRQNIPMRFRDRRISVHTDNDLYVDESRMPKVGNHRIIVHMYGRCMPVLRDFIVSVRHEYQDHLRADGWKQRLFRLKRDSENKGALMWAGSRTYSTKTFETVVLDADVKASVMADFAGFLRAEEWYSTMGLSYKRGYMFHGPPGTGKTSMVVALANEGARDIYSMDLSKLPSDADLDRAFELLPNNCVVMLEDVDCMSDATLARAPVLPTAPAPTPSCTAEALVDALMGEIPTKGRGITLSALLNHMDGVGSNHGRVFILTTNHPEKLDPALVRAGRIDVSVHLGMCSSHQLRQFHALYFGGAEAAGLDDLPQGVLSPADVSSTFQQHRGDPPRAVAELQRIAKRRAARDTHDA